MYAVEIGENMGKRRAGLVFADIAGSTRLYGKIGAVEAKHALERCLRRVERAIDGQLGRILNPGGDDIVAAFDDADSAMHAAIDMQERVADLPPVSGVKLAMRIGVHFGSIDDTAGLSGEAFETGRALLNIAGPRQIVTCAQTAKALSPILSRKLGSLPNLALRTSGNDTQLYALEWTEGTVAPGDVVPLADAGALGLGPHTTAGAFAPRGVCVRIFGKAYLVDDRTPALTLGRDRESDISLASRKTSRQHARVEMRAKHRFFLIDSSTNGTYVAFEGEKEVLVRNEEIQLTGRGQFSCGLSLTGADAEIADFEIV